MQEGFGGNNLNLNAALQRAVSNHNLCRSSNSRIWKHIAEFINMALAILSRVIFLQAFNCDLQKYSGSSLG